MKYLAFAAILFTAACSQPRKDGVQAAAPAKQEPVEVEVAPAVLKKTDRSILVTGSLSPDEIVTMVSEVPGRITSVKVDFGQTVRKGDVIAEIDKTEYQLQLDRSKAALAQAKARLGGAGEDGNPTLTNTPAMRQAWAQAEDAKFKFENARKLVKSGDISQERFNELEKAYRAREAAFEASRDDMRTQWANVDALQADVRIMEKRLRDTILRAPFDGSVSERKVSPGQYVKDNAPILTLVKTHPLRLRAEVPESAAGAVRVGTALEFTTDSAPNANFTAAVRELNPALSEQSRTLIAEARLTSADPRLRPGMFVQVRLILDRNVEAVVVPRQAVYVVAGLTKVFVVRQGKIVECRVSPGRMIDGGMEVPAGVIRAGDRVVITNLPELTGGQEVRVKGNA
ncbi:MAG TPA: efflux RND transporter periplasmic adaptor subunit [Bryobacteraceae bacterium]|nr:efflux RND transporter periplasmic adaptor subunit [Bryobacteraceae bacterium]